MCGRDDDDDDDDDESDGDDDDDDDDSEDDDDINSLRRAFEAANHSSMLSTGRCVRSS